MVINYEPIKDFIFIAITFLIILLAVVGIFFITTGKTVREHTVYIENGQKIEETYTWENK